jgi:hypothetical protein
MIIKFSKFSGQHLIFDEKFKSDILAGMTDNEQKNSAARNIVDVHLFRGLKNDPQGDKLLKSLIKRGYTLDDINQSIAQAWLANQDYFELKDFNHRVYNSMVARNFLIPISLTFIILGGIFYVFRKKYPIIFIDIMIIAPPLVAIVGGAIFYIFYRLFKKKQL